jgi:D-cysteine desulfhydrase
VQKHPGLALGLELAGLATRVLAVRVVESPLCNRVLLELLLVRTARLLARRGVSVSARASGRRLLLVGNQVGRGYGSPTSAALAAVEAAAAEGLALETTYTGKAFAALLALAARRGAGQAPRILFWNTHNSRDLGGLAAAGKGQPLPAEVAAWLARG